MKGAVLYGPRDVRFEERDDPTIIEPTDAIIRVSASCVCGSDLWPYRGIEMYPGPQPMGHEYCGIVEEVGSAVRHIKRGQFVVGSFFASDNTCSICRAGYQGRCVQAQPIGALGAQAPFLRVPLADGTLVATPAPPSDDLIPSLLAASDVLGTGWFAADAAAAGPGKTVAVVGDGAVGLLGVLAAKQMGAERIILMSRHEVRQKLGLEAVGTQESMMQAIRATRPGGHVGFVGVSHGVELPGLELFFAQVNLLGGPAPVRRYLPELIDLIWKGQINPGKVFDLALPLEQVAEGYRAMDERRAIKTLLTV